MAGLVLFDTNILIDWSKGYAEALNELAHWDNPAISAVSWMEFYGGAEADDLPKFDEAMAEFGVEVIGIDATIMQCTASLLAERRRNGPRIRLADAIIQATADLKQLTIFTRNTKDFRGANVRVPYELHTTSTVTVINVDPPGDVPTSGLAGRRSVSRVH